MSTANGRPLPPPSPSQRTQKAESEDGRSTGVRARSPSNPIINEIDVPIDVEISSPPESAKPLAEGIRNNSIAPESLRKPYASLAPQPKDKRSQTSPRRSTTGPRPQLDSVPNLEDELTNPGQTSSGRTTTSRAAGSKPARSICKKHKIAKGKNGECMLCRKEESEKSNGLGWKLMLGFIVVAVVVSAVMAALVKFK